MYDSSSLSIVRSSGKALVKATACTARNHTFQYPAAKAYAGCRKVCDGAANAFPEVQMVISMPARSQLRR